MRLIAVIAVMSIFSLACAGAPCGEGTVERDGECVAAGGGGGDNDTGDVDTEPTVVDAYATDEGDVVVWTIEIDGSASSAELWILETGAPDYSGDCDKSDIPTGDGGLACNVWSEHHTAFRVADTEGGITTLELQLAATDSISEQSRDDSTLFQDPFLDTSTFLVEIDGGALCAVGGDDPSTFAQDCSNTL